MSDAVLSPTGKILRQWRASRAKSQLALAMDAGISARHLSFIETGRSTPSREMLVLLSGVLDIPLRQRNTLLQASGYAPIYHETLLDAPEMEQVNRAIDCILHAHTISPAVVVNRRYDVLRTNTAAALLTSAAGSMTNVKRKHPNLLRLLLSPDCLRPAIENWDEVSSAILQRVQREALMWESDDDDLRSLLNELSLRGQNRRIPGVDWTRAPDLVIPLRIRTDRMRLSLFSTITMLGTPCDITLQELRVEAFHPADRESEETLARLLEQVQRDSTK
jgi:transcriptional regulator with XRE-family HTH domain